MDIGGKLQRARKQANITQEKAAEALGVSRQTLSNWENEKTYPDIVSVVKMSDLYDISLDRLLKEEKPVSDYLDYLEESTNVVKSRNKLSKLVLIMTYLVIWAVSLIVFWLFMDPAGALGYSLMFLWLLLPVTTFVLSLLIGRNNFWGKWKWLSAAAFGLMYMLADYATFKAANMVSNGIFRMPDFIMLFAGVIISVLGLGIGAVFYYSKSRTEVKK